MVKAIFFDVDGTLLSHTKMEVCGSTRTALHKLAALGIKRVVATGRHTTELSMLPLDGIAFDAYITLNGQLCLNADGAILSENPILGEDEAALAELFKEKTVPLMLVEKDRMYINFADSRVEKAQQAISTPVPEMGEYAGARIYQAIAYVDKETEQQILDRLPHCKITRWNPYAVDIIAASGGKVSGIKAYLNCCGIAREETMAFGDGENDVEMLRYVHTGIAMGNADERTKESADYVTASVDENGIMEALLALGVI